MEVEHQGFCSRQVGAICSMCVGIILVPCVIAGIFWNESNAVLDYATADVVKQAHSVAECAPSSADDSRLVLAACDVRSPNLALDPQMPDVLRPFVPAFNGSELTWTPEVWLYHQTSTKSCKKDNHGGQTCVTHYSCSPGWTKTYIDSSGFKCHDHGNPTGLNLNHQLPRNMAGSRSVQAKPYTVVLAGAAGSSEGRYKLDTDLALQLPLASLSGSSMHGPTSPSRTYGRTGEPLDQRMLGRDGEYLVTYSGAPNVGDVRIGLSGRSAGQATVVAKQEALGQAFTFTEWPPHRFGLFGKETKPLEKLLPGKLSAKDFREKWDEEISGRTWLLRLVFLVVMIVAFGMIFAPLSVAADLLRALNFCTCCLGSLLDDMAQCAICVVALTAALVLYVLAVAVAWIVARPALGSIMLVVCVLLVFAAERYTRKSRRGARTVHLEEGGGGGAVSLRTAAQAPQQQFLAPAPQQQILAPAPRQQQFMQVVCPAGVRPGDSIPFVAPSGQTLMATVPGGISPGQPFRVAWQA